MRNSYYDLPKIFIIDDCKYDLYYSLPTILVILHAIRDSINRSASTKTQTELYYSNLSCC